MKREEEGSDIVPDLIQARTRPSICDVWRRAQAGDGVAFGAVALSAMRMHCSSLWRCRCVSIALVAAIGKTESRCEISHA